MGAVKTWLLNTSIKKSLQVLNTHLGYSCNPPNSPTRSSFLGKYIFLSKNPDLTDGWAMGGGLI